jgi:hypothetical protein
MKNSKPNVFVTFMIGSTIGVIILVLADIPPFQKIIGIATMNFCSLRYCKKQGLL